MARRSVGNPFIGCGIMIFAALLFIFCLWLGFWWMFIGGIAGLINAIKSPNSIDGLTIAINIAKIIFCEAPIAFGFWFCFFVGAFGAFVGSDS